jgi:hypothetical protein
MVSDYASALGWCLEKAVDNSEYFCIYIIFLKNKMDVFLMDTLTNTLKVLIACVSSKKLQTLTTGIYINNKNQEMRQQSNGKHLFTTK